MLTRTEVDDWVGLWDRDNPKSVWSRVRESMRVAMDAIPEKTRLANPDFLYKNHRPSECLQNARFIFWEDFGRHETRKIIMSHVFNGARSTYYEMLKKPQLLMWFLSPPKDFAASQKSILDRTHQLVREALTDENLYIKTIKTKTNRDGSTEVEETVCLNTKAVAEARKLMESMTERVQGTMVGKLAVAHQHQLSAVDPLSQITSIDAIFDAGRDNRPMLDSSNYPIEVDEHYRPHEPSTKDESSDLSEFMDE